MVKEQGIGQGTTVLITGGAGFIGSNLCDAVIEMGCDVRCMDNLITEKKRTSSISCSILTSSSWKLT
jgi:UDP-N-acetylglucosamine 4-epimerase